MGFFDKKYCDVCGEKIGLLGNRKLEDGNLCKECAKQLSPFFSDRKHSTVDEIKKQLAYRNENKEELKNFNPDMTFGYINKIYMDRNAQKFIVTSTSKWREHNPDLISFSQVKSVNTDIHENKKEMYYKDEDGKSQSYNPRRYEFDYEFNIRMDIDSPWFDQIELEISNGNRPDSPYTDLYRDYERQINDISSILNSNFTSNNFGANSNFTPNNNFGGNSNIASNNNMNLANGSLLSSLSPAERVELEEIVKMSNWMCKNCNSPNMGTMICHNCGCEFNDENIINNAKNIAKAKAMSNNSNPSWQCTYCGSINTGNFCENCGAEHK